MVRGERQGRAWASEGRGRGGGGEGVLGMGQVGATTRAGLVAGRCVCGGGGREEEPGGRKRTDPPPRCSPARSPAAQCRRPEAGRKGEGGGHNQKGWHGDTSRGWCDRARLGEQGDGPATTALPLGRHRGTAGATSSRRSGGDGGGCERVARSDNVPSAAPRSGSSSRAAPRASSSRGPRETLGHAERRAAAAVC